MRLYHTKDQVSTLALIFIVLLNPDLINLPISEPYSRIVTELLGKEKDTGNFQKQLQSQLERENSNLDMRLLAAGWVTCLCSYTGMHAHCTWNQGSVEKQLRSKSHFPKLNDNNICDSFIITDKQILEILRVTESSRRSMKEVQTSRQNKHTQTRDLCKSPVSHLHTQSSWQAWSN
jgi:hypothetical protein